MWPLWEASVAAAAVGTRQHGGQQEWDGGAGAGADGGGPHNSPKCFCTKED